MQNLFLLFGSFPQLAQRSEFVGMDGLMFIFEKPHGNRSNCLLTLLNDRYRKTLRTTSAYVARRSGKVGFR
ncbi:hypothetical protein OVY01_21295 [Robbsia sp. Bb-Pol-6]|uniref:Uncharacterized protein n=1 Tax=Robbsia betulipollinis TaxID=2981849 RepID=A0ABT3ZTZ7_9BURK|nr:hypothetical protein [Robbsia betulipollinis]